jgi:hypothetical protein
MRFFLLIPVSGKLLSQLTGLKGKEMKLATDSLDEWLLREKVEYKIENLTKIENFIKENWSSSDK